jgi:hypothetical protein
MGLFRVGASRQGSALGGYNEVVLRDRDRCYQNEMPHIVEAVFARGRDPEQLRAARTAHSYFVRHFHLHDEYGSTAEPPLILYYRPGEGFAFDPEFTVASPIPPAVPSASPETAIPLMPPAMVPSAPPISPPPISPAPPISPGMERTAQLNAQFFGGRPSNDAAEAGVFIRGFDQLTHSNLPWEVYWPHSTQKTDRLSGSIANARLPYIYMRTPWGQAQYNDDPPGPHVGTPSFVVTATFVNDALLCSYDRDAATTNDRAYHGCARQGSRSPSHLKAMLEAHESRAVHCQASGNINNCYNEVILDAHKWRQRLPDAIAAFSFPLGCDMGASGCSAQLSAAAARHRFLCRYDSVDPSTVPLVSFDRTNLETPFSLVSANGTQPC